MTGANGKLGLVTESDAVFSVPSAESPNGGRDIPGASADGRKMAEQVRASLERGAGAATREGAEPDAPNSAAELTLPLSDGSEDGAATTRPSVAYESPRVTLWHGKAEDVLPTLPTESFDLICTDPPYGVGSTSGWTDRDRIHNDRQEDRGLVGGVLRECVRLVGQKRHLYVFGPADVLDGLKVSETADLVWDRGVIGQGNLASTWGPQHEPITFAVSMHRHAGQAGRSSPAVRMRKGSVLRFMRPTGRKVRHPHEKPVALLRELIESSTRSGDIVLDPFAGSASTGVAAVLTGRRAVLVESDERWVSLAIERLRVAEAVADQMEAVA